MTSGPVGGVSRRLRLGVFACLIILLGASCVYLEPIEGMVVDISDDGRYVLLRTDASLVAGDTNQFEDLYRKDMTDGSVIWVSPTISGQSANADVDFDAAISGDGRYAVFMSAATNMQAATQNPTTNAFPYLRDLRNGTTERLGDQFGLPSQFGKSIDMSGDGNVIVYQDGRDIVEVRRDTNVERIVNVSFDGSWARDTHRYPSVNHDGSAIAWESDAPNLVENDTNDQFDIFVRIPDPWNPRRFIIKRVSESSDGIQATGGDSVKPVIAAFAKVIVFQSTATNLLPFSEDSNNVTDVYAKNYQTGSIERVSVASDGAQASTESGNHDVSGDGTRVVFLSGAPELDGRIDGETGVATFVHDRSTGATVLMNTDALGNSTGTSSANASGPIFATDISTDGHYVAVEDDSGDTPTDDDVEFWFRFVDNPTIDSISPAEVGAGTTTQVVIVGSGFHPDLPTALQTDLLNAGADGIVFKNIEVANESKIVAEVVVDKGVATGTRQVNLIIDGTGPGPDSGAFAYCGACLTVVG